MSQFIGNVSAFAYAQTKGYTGTEEEFAQLMAHLASVRAEAETLPEGSEATASYENGVIYIGVPKGDTGEKGDKGDKGDTGNGISSVTLISKVEGVATYRIQFTDGDHFDYQVTDGEVTEERLSEALAPYDALGLSVVDGEVVQTFENIVGSEEE